MAELYNNSRFANSSYVPQFVGSNFETIKDAADRLDLRYRQNRELSDKLAVAMANDKYHAADQHIGDAIYDDFNDTIDQVASSDQNFENSTGIIANKARDYGTNRNRIVALDNAKRYEDYLAQKQELGANGQDFTQAFTGTLNEDGSTNRFRPGLEKKLDYDKQKETYFNQIEADLKQQGYTQDQINQEFLKSTITGGISKTKIGKYVEEAMNRHKTTAEYDQEKRALMRDGLNSQQAEESISRSLLSTGLERVHGISKQDLQRHSEHYLKGMYDTPVAEPFVPSSPGVPQVNTNLKPLISATSNLHKDQTGQAYQVFDKNGTPVDAKVAEKAVNDVNGAGGSMHLRRIGIRDMYDLKPVDDNLDLATPGTDGYQYKHLTENMSERQQKLLKEDNGNQDYTLDTFNKAYKESEKGHNKIAESGEHLTKDNTPIYENYFKGAGLRAATIVEGETEPTTLKEVINKLKLERTDKLEVIPTRLNRSSPNKNLGANIEGEIYVNGNPVKSFTSTLSDGFDHASSTYNDVIQNSLYAGQDKYTKNNPKAEIINTKEGPIARLTYTTTIPTPNRKVKFDTEVHVGQAPITGYDKDGNPIIGEATYNYKDDNGNEHKESYTIDQYKAKQLEISKKLLRNQYASGQMTKNDTKDLATE